MKKTILSLAILAISAAGAAAQTTCPQTNATCTANTECTAQPRGKACIDRYKGLNLTDSQREQLRKLDADRCNTRQANAKEMRQTKQRNDSARMVQRRADRKSYLDQVKSIVGPDQYVIFLENFYLDMPSGNHHKALKFDKKLSRGHGKQLKFDKKEGKKERR